MEDDNRKPAGNRNLTYKKKIYTEKDGVVELRACISENIDVLKAINQIFKDRCEYDSNKLKLIYKAILSIAK